MRKQKKGHRFLNAAVAAILACGMMVPAGAMAWADNGGEAALPPSENATTFDQVVGELPQQGSVGETVSYIAQTAASFAVIESDAVPAAAPVATPMAVNTVTVGGFTFTGEGIADSDFSLAGGMVTINTSATMTVTASAATNGLLVPAGKTANLILNGVSVTANIPFDIKAGGRANLILADDKTNSFTAADNATGAQWPGIHCGTGATLTIDDSVANKDTSGNPIIPVKGQIPAGVTYVDAAGKIHTSTGDPLTNLDAAKPGTLNVQGGGLGAGIGGAVSEDGGSMTFNGGTINVTNGRGTKENSATTGRGVAGAGIGGGRDAAGTSPSEWITINGGRITANAAFHGAGIGGGWNTTAIADVAVPAGSGLKKSDHPAGTGNIRINGGYIVSNGGNDGNGFGRGCYGNQKNCDNRDYTILITGGTMIPSGGTNLGEWGMDIGGAGTTYGASDKTIKSLAANVCISGGSVKVGEASGSTPTNKKYRFDGIAYGSFTENADGSITINRDAQVVPVTINLSADLAPDLNRLITAWTLVVNGVEVNYGAPAQFNDGNLYLWLSPEQAKQNVEVRLSYKGTDGSNVAVDPLYRPAGSTGTDTNLKRYVFFDLQSDFYNEAGGSTSQATVPYDALSSYEQKKYGDSQDASGNVTVPTVTKPYDGLPYSVRQLSQASPINSGGDDKKDIYSDITYVAQVYDSSTGKLGAEQAATTLPSDTGLTRFTMTSTQYSKDSADNAFKESYYGHRAYGWCAITPVPAVVKMAADGATWGRLSEDGASFTEVKDDKSEAGNRLRVVFDVRSAKGTATTCKAPTGAFQILIDGNPVGGPIPLTEAAMAASKGSRIQVVAGDEGRETTHVEYYLDPTRLDGALEALEGAGDNVHKVTVQYLPDKNYVEGVEEDTPEDEKTIATQPTTIIPVKPTGNVTPDGPGGVTVTAPPDPTPGPGGADPDSDEGKITVVRKTIRASYGEFHSSDPAEEIADFFKLAIESSSDMPPTFDVSNPAVADVRRSEGGQQVLEGGKLPVQVNSCGTSVITVEQKGNAIYTGIKYILTVEVTPDKAIKPKVQIRLTSRNLTALSERAEEAAGAEIPEGDVGALVAAVAAVYASDAGRADLPPRPGDVMEYTVTGINMTPGSAWQGAMLTDAISATLKFDPASVEVARNYTTHSDQYTLGTPEFYQGFDWDGLAWEPVAPADYDFTAPTLSKNVGSVYGGQSTSVRFRAEVAEHTGDRPEEGAEPPVIESRPGGSGGYGKDEEELQPGEEAQPAQPLAPGTDIVVVGDGGTAEGDPLDPKDADPKITDPVLPKDPAAADIETTVKVETIATEETHEPDRILVGDTIRVTATSTNRGPDSKLVDAVVKVTLPKGAEPKEGTIKLVTPDGEYTVPDSAYDPATGIIAVSAGDLYGGESAVLTFEAVIESTKETRGPDEQGGERPDDFPIQGGTLGGTPTGEYIDTHPEGPDGPAAPQADKPRPGAPFVPDVPWPELEKKVVTGGPGTDPGMPPVLPRSPKVTGESPDITVEKAAENATRDDGTTHVGDTVRYTITVSNTRAHSIWYDAVVRDNLPKGVEPMSGTIKMTGPDGVERGVPDSAYDPATRVMGVQAGDLAGGRRAVLTFEALVTEDAKGADIGNVGTAYGTLPGDVDPIEATSPEARPTPGEPFQPDEGWGNWEHGKDGISNDRPAYAPGTDASGGVRDADSAPSGLLAQTGTSGSGQRTILAQTGDRQLLTVGTAALGASAALLVLLVAAHRNRRRERGYY